MKDVTGQNILYIAALLGNYKMVDAILKYKIKAIRNKVTFTELLKFLCLILSVLFILFFFLLEYSRRQ